jgi:hypothetical protein
MALLDKLRKICRRRNGYSEEEKDGLVREYYELLKKGRGIVYSMALYDIGDWGLARAVIEELEKKPRVTRISIHPSDFILKYNTEEE